MNQSHTARLRELRVAPVHCPYRDSSQRPEHTPGIVYKDRRKAYSMEYLLATVPPDRERIPEPLRFEIILWLHITGMIFLRLQYAPEAGISHISFLIPSDYKLLS